MSAIFKDTLNELLSRKVLFLFGFVTLLMLLGVYITSDIENEFARQSGGELQVEEFAGQLAPWIARAFSQIMSVLVFLAVLTTVGLIPKALEKGRAEFYLARPISRPKFLCCKLMSIWIIYGLVAVVCGLITYGAVAAMHGMFDSGILMLFLVYMLDLFIWLSIVALAGIVSGSTVWAMTAVFVVWIAQLVLSGHEAITGLMSSKLLGNLVETLYYVVPKTGEIGDLAVLLAVGKTVDTWMPLWSSLLFAVAVLYFAVLAFKRKNY